MIGMGYLVDIDLILSYNPAEYNERPLFEFDPNKSRANKAKHGHDFIEAQRLWDDPRIIRVPLSYKAEPRYVVIGLFNDKPWSAVCTDRAGKIRIISFRRAHPKEEKAYEAGKRRRNGSPH